MSLEVDKHARLLCYSALAGAPPSDAGAGDAECLIQSALSILDSGLPHLSCHGTAPTSSTSTAGQDKH